MSQRQRGYWRVLQDFLGVRKMRTSLITLTAIVAMLFASTASSDELLTSKEISQALQARGADSVAQEMVAAEEPFDHLLGEVRSVKPGWLEIAQTIRPAVTADAAKDLDSALQIALLKAPGQVLPLYAHENVADACYQSVKNEDFPGGVKQRIARLEKSIAAMPDSSLRDLRETCLAGVSMAKREISPDKTRLQFTAATSSEF
jgi:hypothetical protein